MDFLNIWILLELLNSWQDEGNIITSPKDSLQVIRTEQVCAYKSAFATFFHQHFFFFRPFLLNSINVTEEKPVGEIIARVKPTDWDEDGGITYTFRSQQEKFALDPCKF